VNVTVDDLIAIVRAVHFGAVILVAGQFVFLFFVTDPGKPPLHLARSVLWGLAVALATALAWLALEALSMSGLPLERALRGETVGVVLTQTLFGRVWLVRMVLILTSCATLLAARSMVDARRQAWTHAVGAFQAALLLAALAGTGHAAAERGLDQVVHLCADALHLLAAGAWLGSLFPLVFLLGRCARAGSAEALDFAARATQRFSTLGVASMSALLFSGIVNTCYTVSSPRALFQSQYGWLLVAKVTLFGLILCIAAANRIALAPRLSSRSAGKEARARAAERLRRNAVIELALGFGIIAIVGKLGITISAMHAHMH
jgi:copper resistance protein D